MHCEDALVQAIPVNASINVEPKPLRKLRSITELRCEMWKRKTEMLAEQRQACEPASSSSELISVPKEIEAPKLRRLEDLLQSFQLRKLQATAAESIAADGWSFKEAPRSGAQKLEMGSLKEFENCVSTAPGSRMDSECASDEESSSPRSPTADVRVVMPTGAV
mmetsp:Transcript_51906/g.82455  ORF Transcript_51906/g.82455 Transcript_51906/m.82455 type:complete len:164 (+) Transcript_51906:72-563(+)